jgi:hypothetical protein
LGYSRRKKGADHEETLAHWPRWRFIWERTVNLKRLQPSSTSTMRSRPG